MKKLICFILIVGMLGLIGCSLYIGDGELSRRYIIAFDWDVDWDGGDIQGRLKIAGLLILERFDVINGVLARLTPKQAKWVRDNLPVLYIEEDILHSIPPSVHGAVEAVADTEIGWEIKMIRAQEAWKYSKGKGVIVGVIDTGVDPSHPDLSGAVVGGYNGITDTVTSWEDDNGHGTSVAGAIAGRLNGTGIVGAAPEASIYSLKGLNSNGQGYTSALLRCFQKALEEELPMVNCSWGSPVESLAIKNAMENLAAWQGMGVICAAGNSGNSPPLYPASNAVAVCVAAVNTKGQRASFSSYGIPLKKNGVAAPGEWVLAAKMGGGTRRVNGTSIATPYVTGLMALTKAMYWPWRRWAFEGASNYPNPDIYLGYGIIDMEKSLDRLTEEANNILR